MLKSEFEAALDSAVVEAKRWLTSLDQRPVGPEASGMEMLEAFNEALPFKGEAAELVVRTLAETRHAWSACDRIGTVLYAWVVGARCPPGWLRTGS